MNERGLPSVLARIGAKTWSMFSREEAPRCLGAFIGKAQAALALFSKHSFFRECCAEMLDDFSAYLVVLQSAVEPPTVRPSEVSGVNPIRRLIRARGVSRLCLWS